MRISGRQEGDLVAWAAKTRVTGEVTGDLIAAGDEVRIEGQVGDTVRAIGRMVEVSNTVEGDVIAFGANVRIGPEAHVKGNLIVCAATTTIEGTVDGSLLFKGGEVVLRGHVARNLDIEADTVKLGSGAHVGGDISYEARRELEMAENAVVLGEVSFSPREEDDSDDGISAFGVFVRVWLLIGAVLVGLVALALTRPAAGPLVERIDHDALLGGLVGFGTSLIVPAAAFMAIALILPAPLGLFALVLFLMVVYLAKLPVALWIGTRGLSLVGRKDPSPWLALVLGLVVLYLLFWVPYVGKLVWLATVWLGLGTIILTARERWQRQPEA